MLLPIRSFKGVSFEWKKKHTEEHTEIPFYLKPGEAWEQPRTDICLDLSMDTVVQRLHLAAGLRSSVWTCLLIPCTLVLEKYNWGLMERFTTLPIIYCALYYDFAALNVGKENWIVEWFQFSLCISCQRCELFHDVTATEPTSISVMKRQL